MTKIDNGGPAFPIPLSAGESYQGELGPADGMTLRQYAAIHLCVPSSGTDWLDSMIRERERNDLAAKAMQGILSSGFAGPRSQSHYDNTAEASYKMADAMLEHGRKK